MKPNLKKVGPMKPLQGPTPIGQEQNTKEKNRGRANLGGLTFY
jgi:hypothetical protein